MIRRAHLLPILAFAAGFGFDAQARAETQSAVTVDVDARAAGTPLKRVWPFYGYDETNYTTTPDGQELLRDLAAANTAKVGIRTHFLFNTGDGTPGRKWH